MQRDMLVGLATSVSEQEYISLGVEQDLRADGRGRLDYRRVAVQGDVLAQANGSCRVTIAHNGTDVLAAVKVEVGEPSAASPDEGRIECSVECSNSLFPKFDDRSSSELNAAMSLALGRALMGSGSINLRELCIIPGKFCWVVFVDVLVLQADGNLLDAASFASYVAINTTLVPKVSILAGEGGKEDDFELSGDFQSAERIRGADMLPIVISLSKIGQMFLADTSIEEESVVGARVCMAVNRKGVLCGIHKEGTESIPLGHMPSMASSAGVMAKGIFDILNRAVTAVQDSQDSSQDASVAGGGSGSGGGGDGGASSSRGGGDGALSKAMLFD